MNRLSDLALMQLHVETLFVLDDDGRLLFINEPLRPEEHPAPLVFMGRTNEGTVCRCRHDAPAKLCAEIEQVAQHNGGNPPADSPTLSARLKRRLEMSGLEVGRVWEGPAYIFGEMPPNGEGVVLDSSHAQLLRKHFDDIIPELDLIHPCVAAVVEGNAVSLCRTVRRSPHAVEAGVNTAAGYRRRGLATQVVVQWASLVYGLGLLPMYSTSWNNVASRGLAAKLGLVQYGTDLGLSHHRE